MDKSYLRIRSPTQLMTDSRDNENHQSIIETQWCHHPDELIINSCNYMAKVCFNLIVYHIFKYIDSITSILAQVIYTYKI